MFEKLIHSSLHNRLMVMVLDSRGARDVFRADKPILGPAQWTFVDQVRYQVRAEELAATVP